MNIQELKLSFPYDFLEHLIKTRYNLKSQYFTAGMRAKGESIKLNRAAAPISVIVTPEFENVSISITRDTFECQHSILRCAFNEWKESNEKLKTNRNVEHLSYSPKSEVKKCSVVLHDILDNTSKKQLDQSNTCRVIPRRKNVKEELSQPIRNKHVRGLQSRKRGSETRLAGPTIKKDKVSPTLKTRHVNVEQKISTPKVRNYTTRYKHLSTPAKEDISADEYNKHGSESRSTGPTIKKDKVSPTLKTRHVNVEQKISTPKVRNYATGYKQLSTPTKEDISADECQKQDLMKSINLRPRRNIVDWSALAESESDSHDVSDDQEDVCPNTSLLNLDANNQSAPRDTDQLPEWQDEVQKPVLPIIITVSPSDVPLLQSTSHLPQPAAVKTSLAQTGLISQPASAKLAPNITQHPLTSPTVSSPAHHQQSATPSASTPVKTRLTPTTCLSDAILKSALPSGPLTPQLSQPNQTETVFQTPTMHPSFQATSVQTLQPLDNNGSSQLTQLDQDNANLPPPSHGKGKKYKTILPKMGKNIAKAIKPVDRKVNTKVQTNLPDLHISMSKVFPVQVVPGRIQVTEGQEGQLTLTAQSETESENMENTKVSFYTNISKGIEHKPLNYPKEFKPVMMQDDISIPIVIIINKVKKKASKERKQVTVQEKTEQVSEQNTSGSNVFDSSIETNSSTGATEHGSLKETSDTLETFIIFLPSDSSSEDSTADYTDDSELPRPSGLSVVYTHSANMTDLTSSLYTKLGVGNKIPGIDFLITSSVLLKTLDEWYYIQGEVDGVEGTVLLGPFALIFHPVPYLNFIKVAEPAKRVPRHIYERQRKRWLIKHDRKRFSRPRGGALADRNLVRKDHDYFPDPSDRRQNVETTEGSEKVNDSAREITPLHTSAGNITSRDKDVVIVSVHGVDPSVVRDPADSPGVEEQEDEDLYTYNKDTELQIPVVGSLVEALGNEEEKKVLPQVADSIYEDVPFDEVPAVVAESTLASLGVQINYRLLGKQNIDLSTQKQNPVVENDDSHHLPMRFTCRYCLKSVQDNFRLAEHIRTCHQDRPGFMDYARQVKFKEGFHCQYCDKAPVFHSRDSIRNHLRIHHPDKVSIPEPFVSRRTCQICKKVFSKRTVLMTHIRRMHEHRRLLCDKCPAIFKSEQGLRNHMNGMHDNIRNYVCHICGSAYVINDYLRRHIRRVHNKSQKSVKTKDSTKPEKQKQKQRGDMKKCPLCRYSFDPLNMKKHLKQIHGETKPAEKKCPDCPETFPSRSFLEYHRITAHDYTYHLNCPFCGIAYVSSKAMQDHVLSVHLDIKLHQCAMCDKVFPRPSPLIEHLLTEHKGKGILEENRTLKCPHCSGIFRTHKSLVEHVLSPSHHELFPHQCPTCLKRFKNESVLNHHIRILHSNDAEFEIRCNSDKDKLVQMVVKQDVQHLGELPPKAQEALKRLQNEGKHVMIVAKRVVKKDQGCFQQSQDKHHTLSEVETDIVPTGKKIEEEFTQSAFPKVQAVTSIAGDPSDVDSASPKVQLVTINAAVANTPPKVQLVTCSADFSSNVDSAPPNVQLVTSNTDFSSNVDSAPPKVQLLISNTGFPSCADSAPQKVQLVTDNAGFPSRVVSASPKVQQVTINASSQTNVHNTDVKSDIESLKIYKIAAQSGETANAVSVIQHQLLGQGTNVVMEEIGRLQEGGGNVEEIREYTYAVTQDPGRQVGSESHLETYVVEDTGKQEDRVLEDCVAAEHIATQIQSVPEKHILTLDSGTLEERIPQEIYGTLEERIPQEIYGTLEERIPQEIYVIQEDGGRMKVNESILGAQFVVTEDIGSTGGSGHMEVERIHECDTVQEEGYVVGKNIGQSVEGGNIVVERIENFMMAGNMGSVEPHYLVAEQIGRLDEDGNVVEDNVVFQEEQHVSDLMYFFQNQS
ncbi:uncharacterized protein [Haliotis asinina]|uniref:uncharacterized protein n=1 Tax=Haliotis asinina TaxID=109174 RepID=UPI00353238A0